MQKRPTSRFDVSVSLKGLYQPLPEYHIRVLVLEPNRFRLARLKATLHTVSLLDNPPEFEALSYAWDGAFDGKKLRDGKIRLNGQITTAITGNLSHALKRLRDKSLPRTLWVDALCINQTNKSERSSQVAMMREVYSRATNVLMWLGEDSRKRDGKIIFTRCKSGRLHPRTGRYRPHIRGAIRLFFTRRYFHRRWCVQEYTTAKRATLFCGIYSMDMQILEESLATLPHRDAYTRDAETFSDLLGLVRNQQTNDNAVDLLIACKDRDCGDNRDRIYSLLALLDNRISASFEVDYEASWDVTARKFARLLVRTEYRYAVQMLCVKASQLNIRNTGPDSRQKRRYHLDEQLPSWMPDFGAWDPRVLAADEYMPYGYAGCTYMDLKRRHLPSHRAWVNDDDGSLEIELLRYKYQYEEPSKLATDEEEAQRPYMPQTGDSLCLASTGSSFESSAWAPVFVLRPCKAECFQLVGIAEMSVGYVGYSQFVLQTVRIV